VEQNVWGLQTATGFNHFNKDVAVMGSTMWQLFEDFMCMLVGVDAESQSQRVDDVTEPHGIQSGSAAPGARTVPLIPHVTNSRVLTSLASLMAGWLHRCHAVGRTTWPLAVERYGVLAGVTAGASLPPPVGSLPHAASVYRPVPPRVPPEFGRDLFGVLLEGIVQVPGVLEEDKEKGYRWLQGLADLAFEDEAYVKALQLYLQAGAIRSAHYCDRSSSMPRDVFTPWVIRRMVAACRAIGASLQAAVLCQSLPQPDHESAFHILQENPLIVARDAAAYFDCVWEVSMMCYSSWRLYTTTKQLFATQHLIDYLHKATGDALC
jgi:integrator complex subunit 8